MASTGHDPYLSANHDPSNSDVHDGLFTNNHTQTISEGGHMPEHSLGHDAFFSANHDPANSDVHDGLFTDYHTQEWWKGTHSFWGDMHNDQKGDFLMSSLYSVAKYDPLQNTLHNHLEELFSQNPDIPGLEGECHIDNDTLWFFENRQIRKIESAI